MERKRINLALQGGGAHGAFTWGALDRLLEDDRIEIAAISGTSAGTLNGAALKSGMVTGGAEGARAALDALWHEVAGLQGIEVDSWMAPFGLRTVSQAMEMNPLYLMGEAITRSLSPYALGPFYTNPLTSIVKAFNYDKVCADTGPEFFVNATRVRNGKLRVFKAEEVNADVIMASACLPTLFQAVELFDNQTGRKEAFWDGGYTGNPALFPFFEKHLPPDIVVININPLERDGVPYTPQQIQNRINEISFNSSLLREMRAIALVQRLLDDGTLPEKRMARVHMHMIADDELMNDLSVATKTVPNGFVLGRLKEAGRAAAGNFLRLHFDDLNQRSSIDMRAMYN
ncbi:MULTISPECIES: patatin-like phospholipase family protein [Roseobacteraceae]|uniref:Patatin-like phospholipase n=1 Tax=Pseudosulfitobacter pseudonitzschiae TaxID=1402135 RepID=A0A221K0C1_9RHOB|nr:MULTISPECIES: patatin-like phospholipase family protein [Roseobacteraceae]ASM72421.1 patatin-like phospholipase [Pseudosulfitobacter pseudonitzschiae]